MSNTPNEWIPLEFRRTMPDGEHRHAWTDDGEKWSARIISAKGRLDHEALNMFAKPEHAMVWADTKAEEP